MSDNYNIEALKMALDLINKNKDKLSDEQKKEFEDADVNINEVEKAFKDYDKLVKDLPNQIEKIFKTSK